MRACLIATISLMIIGTSAVALDRPVKVPALWLACQELRDARYAWKLVDQDVQAAYNYVTKRRDSNPSCLTMKEGSQVWAMERLVIDKVAYECLRPSGNEGCYWAQAVTDLVEPRRATSGSEVDKARAAVMEEMRRLLLEEARRKLQPLG